MNLIVKTKYLEVAAKVCNYSEWPIMPFSKDSHTYGMLELFDIVDKWTEPFDDPFKPLVWLTDAECDTDFITKVHDRMLEYVGFYERQPYSKGAMNYGIGFNADNEPEVRKVGKAGALFHVTSQNYALMLGLVQHLENALPFVSHVLKYP